MQQKQKSKKSSKIEVQKLIGLLFHKHVGSFTDKQSIIYSLAIGFSQDPIKQEDLKFTSDVSSDFMAFPTAASVTHKTPIIRYLMNSQYVPPFNLPDVRHAGQKITMIKDKIQLGVEYYHESTIVDIIDKGKNAIVWYDVNSYIQREGKKQLAYICSHSVFLKGLGGFGFQGKNIHPNPPPIPQRPPDLVKKVQTFPNQAFLFRLTGDRNPLHIDPQLSKPQNLQRPIIHGLATYGSVARVFVQQILHNDPSRYKSYYTLFIGFVYPGQTLTFNLWKIDQLHYIFQTLTQSRKTKVTVGTFQLKPQPKL